MSKHLNKNARMVILIVGSVAVLASVLFVPALLFVVLGLHAILGVVISAAFAYDWMSRGDEDFEAAREEADRRHARIV